VWNLHEIGARVLLRTSESFDGWLVWLFRAAFQRVLDNALEAMLHSLKAAAEKSVGNKGTAA
jgi:hypothetical protein